MAKGSLEKYRRRIKESKKWREDEQYDALWRRLIDLYAGKHFDSLSREDRIAVNIAFATLNVIYPSIAVNYPKISLTARNPDDNEKAIIAEVVLEYLWKDTETGAAEEYQRAVKDYLMIGHGWIKTGWRYREQDQARSEEAIRKDYEAARDEANEAAMADPAMAADMPTNDDIMQSIPTTEQVVVEDRVFVERVSPFDVYVDPDATTERDMKWIAQKVTRTLDEVKTDKRYKARARNKVQSDVTSKWSDEAGKRRRPTDVDRVTVWEFYDLEAQTMCVFAELGDGYLVDPTPIPTKIGIPFVMLRNYNVPDRFYPMGDLEAIEPLQAELNRTRSQLLNARTNYARKYLADESFLSPAARKALESKADGEIVPVNTNNGSVKLTDVITVAPQNNIPGDLFSYGEMVLDDIDKVSGVSEYQRGGGADIRRTATEASMIQDAVNARSADKLAAVEKGIAKVGKNMLELARQYMTGDKIVSFVGTHGKPVWVPYTQEDIDVEADFVVEGGSTMPQNESYRQNMAMQLLQATAPMIGTVIDPAEMAKYVLKAFGVKAPEKMMMQAPPMMPGMGPGGPGPEGQPPDPTGNELDPDQIPAAMAEAGAGAPPIPGAPPGDISQIPPEILAQLMGQVGVNY